MNEKTRCPWCGSDPLYVLYHDNEWGTPVRDESRLFEMLILEGAQAGLSWITILRKRQAYYRAFDGFDVDSVARYGSDRVGILLRDPGIVRNRRKVESAVSNARAVVKIRDEWGSFGVYLWSFVGGSPLINRWERPEQVPSETAISRAISKDMKRRGFSFVGPVILYSFMQSVGLVNDHLIGCFRHPSRERLP
ncbi:MAG: DNA-3-methyladenine glycosylase I [Dethiosulfovibrio peptidovorans]|nr:MAG: DNA-3-methyladenine glycosylase I [Dethiosulfovibrio peptidovorans]